uniref:Uncharacterized protein n=1 Tax=Anguilla anguilla TaxID=7936 RepID=A0A0E9WTG5_ANGAN
MNCRMYRSSTDCIYPKSKTHNYNLSFFKVSSILKGISKLIVLAHVNTYFVCCPAISVI